jgi:hypothetical protein
MIFNNKQARGIPKKNLVPDFNNNGWFQDATALGGVVEVDPDNPYKMKLTISAGAQGRLIWIPVKMGKTYTLSLGQCTGLYRAYSGAVRFHSDPRWLNKGVGNDSITFTVDASYGEYITLRFTAGSAGYYYFENFQLEEGNVATPFEPYKEINPVSKVVPQKNQVLPFTSPKWQLHANAKAIDENTLELNATAANQFSMVDLYLKPNTNYTISMGQCDGVYKINDDKAMAISSTYNQKGTVTFNSGSSKKVTLFFHSTGAGKFIFKKPMIEEGSVATAYEKYKEDNRKASLVPKKNLIDFSEKGMRVYGGSPPSNLTWNSGRVSFNSVGNYSGIQPNLSPILEVGKAYVLSFKGHNLRLVANYGTLVGTTVVYDGGRTSLKFTPTKSTGFLAIENSSLTNASCWAEEVQLELGSVSTEYSRFELAPKKANNTVLKPSYKNYPFTFKRESVEVLDGVQYRMNAPRFKDGGLFIEEGVTNSIANSDKAYELKVNGSTYGQVTYNHDLPKKLVVQSTDNTYTLQFEVKKLGTSSKPFTSLILGAKPSGDNWSWRVYDYEIKPSEIEELEDGWQRITRTFTIQGTKGEYLQSFVKFVSELRDSDIYNLIRNVQIEEKPYRTTYTTGFRKSETAVANVTFDKYAGSIETAFNFVDIPTKSQYIFDTGVPRWILYKDAWDGKLYVYLEGNSYIVLPKSVLINGDNTALIEWRNGYSSLTLNGVKVGTGTYPSADSNVDKAVYLGSRYTGVEHLNNVIKTFTVKDRNGKVTYKI